MQDYKIALGVYPTNDYQKARKDLIEALQSFSKLSSAEKEQLCREFISAETFAAMCRMAQQYFG